MSADHMAVLTMSLVEFETFIQKIDTAVASGSAAIVYSRESRTQTIDVFSRENTDFGGVEWPTARETALSLDSLLVFAFNDAPRSVVRSWADEHGENLGDKAVDMVRVLRESAPALRNEWTNRIASIGRTLGEVRASVVFSPQAGQSRALLRIEAFEMAGLRPQPVAGSHQSVDAALSRADLNRMISELQDAARFMASIDELGADDE